MDLPNLRFFISYFFYKKNFACFGYTAFMDYRALLNDLQYKGPIQKTVEEYEETKQQFQSQGISKPMEQIMKQERNKLWYLIFVKLIYIHFLQREKWILQQQHQTQFISQHTTPAQRMDQIHRQMMQLWSQWFLRILDSNAFVFDWSIERGNLLKPMQETNSWKQYIQQASSLLDSKEMVEIKDLEERRDPSKKKMRRELRYQLKSMLPASQYKPIPNNTEKQVEELVEQIEWLHKKYFPTKI